MRKRNLKVLSMLLAASMAVPQTAGAFVYTPLIVQAETTAASESRGQKDAVYDAWTQDQTAIKGEDTICAAEDGWLHLKASAANGDGTADGTEGGMPAILVNPNNFDFSKDGYFEGTIKDKTSGGNASFGIYLGYKDAGNGMFVGYDADGWFWQKLQNGDGDRYSDSTLAAPEQEMETSFCIAWTAGRKVTLTVGGQKVFEEDFSGLSDLTDKIAVKVGTSSGTAGDVYLKDIHYTGQDEADASSVSGSLAEGAGMMNIDAADTTSRETGNVAEKKISSESMDVYVAENFPRVVRYEMKQDLAGKTFYGQSDDIHTIRINGTDVALGADDVKTDFSQNGKAIYTMTVKEEASHIDAVITAELAVDKNTLAFQITEIKNNLTDTTVNKYGEKVETYPVETIAIPNHSLISVRSTQKDANLKGAIMSSNTKISGDESILVNDEMEAYTDRDYMYAFLSNDEMSAGLWSNSEHEGRSAYTVVNGGSHNTRILATSQEKDGYKELGLASAHWYYHRNLEDSHGVRYTVEESEMPQTKVVITGDENEDAQIDWQDGAIAFRDIMNNPYKCEEVPELVAYRIAMNFGGQAQNPFLTTLDNVKRVAQHTDGLGQSVLLKGYGSEGHDSGHPDYANIGERIGGAEDMNTLMEKGAAYGARFGIHVNVSEMYPEAKAFDDNSVRRYTKEDNDAKKNPALIGTLKYGWNWLDQGVGIDGFYDLGTGARRDRFNELKGKVGDNLDFVYVDVWGNLTSSRTEDSWETRHITDEITDNGWRMATEWGSTNEYDSTFQHWAADLTYGGFDKKGENSEVMRFLRNHQKDSWVGDYPSYGGAAIAPLLGGYNMKDFEGWQGRNDYDAYITNLYTHDLTTKFLQHYKVVKWVDGETADFKGYTWTPEKEITLEDDKGNKVVVTRESTDPSSASYRNRTITLNGKIISQGAVSKGDTGKDGTESYLIPWNWDPKTGEEVSPENKKMYHWNTKGGTTTWELQDDWKTLGTVKVYKLTDLGKTEEKTVDVVNGSITLDAEAQTPYVVCKGEEGNLEITWSEGMHLTDVGFNAGEEGLNTYWTKTGEGTASIAKSQYSNPMLKLDGEVAMTQEITGLERGKKYVLYVGVDNRSDSEARIEVRTKDEVLDSNHTYRSIAKNYVKAYTHSNFSATVDNSSYFQNMYVFFTAPEDGSKVTLTISKGAGEGSTYFDDIRVVESGMDVIEKDENGKITGLSQDFENNVQGIYPFVIGPIEGVEDNRTHLSEAHAPYTQAGWDVKKVDDVLDGNWSLKTNGLTGSRITVLLGTAMLYQTIPQNFRFEPGRTYKVSFDYQAGSDNTYAVTVGDGEFLGKTPLQNLPKAMGEDQDGHFEMQLVGAASGESWFGISSTGTAADTQGTKDAAADFGGYKDFVLDNLKIELVKEEITRDSLNALIAQAEDAYEEKNYTLTEWTAFKEVLIDAKVAANRDKTNQEEMEEAYYALKVAMSVLDQSAGSAGDDRFDISVEQYTVTAGSVQKENGSEGPVEFAVDGDAATYWHTDKSVNAVESQEAWFNIHFDGGQTVDGIRYLPRTGSAKANGKLKTADIQISKDNGKTYETIVENALFDTETKWQKVPFAETEKVTDVRIIPKETAGLTASTTNKYASAAELRVTHPVVSSEEVDKAELKTAVDEASKILRDGYTTASWEVLQEKLTEAKAVLKDGDATAYDVALALANLGDAVADLALKAEISIDALQNAVDLARQVPTEDIADPSAADKFKTALADAEELLAKVKAQDETVTQEMVDDSCKELTDIMQSLEYKKVDKTELEKLVQAAESLDLEKYLDEGKEEFKKALEEAKVVLGKEGEDQEAIDAARQNLLNAMNNLSLVPGEKGDKTELEKLVKTAEGLDLGKYQDKGKEEFKKALAAAKAVAAKEDADQGEIDTARKNLLMAMKNLSLKPEKEKPSNEKNDTSVQNGVKTGDTTNVPLLAGVMAAALALLTAMTVLRKRNKNRR